MDRLGGGQREKVNIPKGTRVSSRKKAFYTQRGPFEGVERSRTERNGDPLRGGPKLETGAGNAKSGFKPSPPSIYLLLSRQDI